MPNAKERSPEKCERKTLFMYFFLDMKCEENVYNF